MPRQEYHPVQGAYVNKSDPPDPFIESLHAQMLAAYPICGECQRGNSEAGEPVCECHPYATHKHYRSGSGWHAYKGHAHDMLVNEDGRTTRCTHGCGRRGTFSEVPVTVGWK